MEPTEHNPLDLLYPVALGSPTLGRVPSSPSAHSSLSKPAIVRADLVLFEKRITSHFNGLLGASSLRKKPARRLANVSLYCSPGLPLLDCPISRWRDLPRVLANIQQYVDGVPSVCIPNVDEDDRITNDIHTWNEEQCSAMQCALNGRTIRSCPRSVGENVAPNSLWVIILHFMIHHWIDRRVLFTSKVPDPSSGHLKLVDSTCGYSPMWLLQNMFTEQCYAYEISVSNQELSPYFKSRSHTIDILRQKQVPRFEALIGKLASTYRSIEMNLQSY